MALIPRLSLTHVQGITLVGSMIIRLLVLLAVLPLVVEGGEKKTPETLVVLSSRGTHLIKPVLQEFEKDSGISVKIVNNKAGILLSLLEQGKAKGDVLITTDSGSLAVAAQKNLLASSADLELPKNYPSSYYDSEKKWFGVSKRARVIFFNPKKLKEKKLKTRGVSYVTLGDKQFKGELCMRTSKKVYNQALIADLVERFGVERSLEVVSGWVNNLAAPVFASDREVIKAVAKGKCLFGLANSYYLGKLLEKKQIKADSVDILWNKSVPAHTNLSGIGILKQSKQVEQASKLVKWLLTKRAQELFASLNYEYPVLGGVELAPGMLRWGKPRIKDPDYIARYALLHAQAMGLIKESNYK